MSDPENDTVELAPDLKVRLAARSGQTLPELAEAVLRRHADEQERTVAEYADDEQRWQRYLQTGQSVPFQTVQAKLQGLAAEAARRQGGS